MGEQTEDLHSKESELVLTQYSPVRHIFCEEPVVTLTVAPCDHLPVLTYGQWPEVWEGRIYPGRDLFLRV